ncbi:MAG: hypothetical protein LW825_03045 [Candidatus Jidaibacter sp.]|nr:hypothetical protein [Candidatus Jidaibacter sp.]
MRNIILLGALLFGVLTLSGCGHGDPSRYDVNSPCVTSGYGIYLDQPCERRLPVDNILQTAIIASS